MICCANCGEILTAPVFVMGKPYGYTCASKLKLGVSKPVKTDCYVLAESHDFTGKSGKVTASYQGKRYALSVLETVKNGVNCFVSMPSDGFQIDGDKLYINLSIFTKKTK
jgi:hypothetical protein